MVHRLAQSQQIHFPPIEPFLGNCSRPFWSVMITSYRRTDYLEKALRSVLAQDPGGDQMQIEVVDDCSPNQAEIEAIVKKVGQGRISFYSSPANNGIFGNWNVCIQRARGHWVHILSDDDLVLPGFYEDCHQAIEEHSCSVVLGQSIYIDEQDQWIAVSAPLQPQRGLLKDALKVLAKSNRVHTPAIVVAREAYEKVGGFTTSLIFTPDWEMWTRLASTVEMAYVNKPFSCFRLHPGSETSRLMLSGDSILDCFNASQIIQARLSNPTDRQEVEQFLSHWLFRESLELSQKQARQGFYRPALIHVAWALKLSPTFLSIKCILPVLLNIPVSYLKRHLKVLLQQFVLTPS